MAYVAFDLDNTLGYFELTNPLAHLWSPEFVANPEQAQHAAHPPQISSRLRAKLKRARDIFVGLLLQSPDLLGLILRPNLDAFLGPLMRAYGHRKLKAAIIYSNSGVHYSLELAKALIERHYAAPGFFALLMDHWSPLRTADRVSAIQAMAASNEPPHPYGYVEPHKTMETLQAAFRSATGSHRRALIPADHILFVDDRQPKHALEAQEPEGLTYLMPTPYYPRTVSRAVKRRIFLLAMAALDRAKVVGDSEYLHSAFCHRDIPYDWTKRVRIRGAPDLFSHVWREIELTRQPRQAWEDDTADLHRTVQEFLRHCHL